MSTIAMVFGIGAMLGSSLMAGTFFAFSTFVMGALARLPAAEGISAMQSINVVVLNRWFLGVFVGTAGLAGICAALAVTIESEHANWMLIGALAYVTGTFLVTVARNVPLNNRLAKLAAGDADSLAVWRHYLQRWTQWNHVRTVGAAIATVGFACGSLGGAG